MSRQDGILTFYINALAPKTIILIYMTNEYRFAIYIVRILPTVFFKGHPASCSNVLIRPSFFVSVQQSHHTLINICSQESSIWKENQ